MVLVDSCDQMHPWDTLGLTLATNSGVADAGEKLLGRVPLFYFAGLAVLVGGKFLGIVLFHVVVKDFDGNFRGQTVDGLDDSVLEFDLNILHANIPNTDSGLPNYFGVPS